MAAIPIDFTTRAPSNSQGRHGLNEPPDEFFGDVDEGHGHTNGAGPPPIDFSAGSTPGPTIEFLDHDDLFSPEPKADLLVGALGIAPGPVTGFFGQSYVGKSIIAMASGMSIGLGRDLLGVWRVRRGRWAHLDYEQARRRSKTIVQRLAYGFGVGKEELREWMRVAIYPPINLTSQGALDHYSRAFDGCAVATLDALKGLTPGVDENSSQMRDYMGILARASEKTGCVPILVHNAGKTGPEGKGKRPRQEAGRGSSAIFDECQSVFVATAEKGEATHVSHEKDRELGATVPDFYVRIVDVPSTDDPKAGLRVMHLDLEQVEADADHPRVAERERISKERQAQREADERKETERRAARAAEQEDAIRRRDRDDDDAARKLLAAHPEASARAISALLKKDRACSTDRAQAAVARVRSAAIPAVPAKGDA
jgi:hypothetical protein